jgi:hypothetical protein
MPPLGKKAEPMQLGLSKDEFKEYLTKLRDYTREKKWTRMWFKPYNKNFRPFFKGMKFELFEKIQPNYQRYVGTEIVEVRIVVDPRAAKYPIMIGRPREMDMMAIRIYTSVYTIGMKNDKLILLEDTKHRVVGVNYFLDDLEDGKFKITLRDIEMLVQLMLSEKIKTTPTDGIDYSKLIKKLSSKPKPKRKKKKKSEK